MTQVALSLFERLDGSIRELWAGAHAGRLFSHVAAAGVNRGLYLTVMTQVFHYTRHNSINQAVAALRADPEELGLLRYVYRHAKEELGHEQMVLHDLRALDLIGSVDELAPPLPATDALVNYLYGVALRDGPIARLGYSYWAESAYGELEPLLRATRDGPALGPQQMTFFVAHAGIDARHALDVREAIELSVRTVAQAEAVHRVAVTSLWLTLELLDQAFAHSRSRRTEAA